MAESYTPLLLRKTEREFFKLALGLCDEMVSQCELLQKQLEWYITRDFEKSHGVHSLIMKTGETLGKTSRQLTHWVAENQESQGKRGELINLIFRLGGVQSYVESTSYRIDLKEVEISDELSKGLTEMMDLTIKAIRTMDESISLLNRDLEKVIEKTFMISTLEDDVNEVRRRLLKQVVNDEVFSDSQKLFTIAQILGSLEEITDRIELSGYLIENIAVSHLP